MKLEELQDKHKGQLCFVVGAGPSLHFQDLQPLKKHVVIAVNSGILKVPDCDYFVSDDEGAATWNYYKETARKSKCIKLLYEAKLKKHVTHFDPEQVILFQHKTWYDLKTKKYLEGGGDMTKEAIAPIIGARTSLATALHFAYIMGCDPIVLLGADCCHRDGKRYFWQYPGEARAFQAGRGSLHFAADRGRLEGKPVDSHCVEFIDYWNQFAQANAGRANIIYASEGGILKCFPSMTLDEVLKAYREK